MATSRRSYTYVLPAMLSINHTACYWHRKQPNQDNLKHTCCEHSRPLLAGRPPSRPRPLAVSLTPSAGPRDRLRQPMLAWDMSPASRTPVMLLHLPQRSCRLPPDSESEAPVDAAEAAASVRNAPAGPAASETLSPEVKKPICFVTSQNTHRVAAGHQAASIPAQPAGARRSGCPFGPPQPPRPRGCPSRPWPARPQAELLQTDGYAAEGSAVQNKLPANQPLPELQKPAAPARQLSQPLHACQN